MRESHGGTDRGRSGVVPKMTKDLVILDTLFWATALEHRGQIISRDGKFFGYPELSGVLGSAGLCRHRPAGDKGYIDLDAIR